MTNTLDLVEADLQRVEGANGVSYAYRRFGRVGEGVPVVFLQHFRGDIDSWDPALTNPIAAERDVILFDNVGIGSTSGTVPTTVDEMAQDAITFIEALSLTQVDLFGFSSAASSRKRSLTFVPRSRAASSSPAPGPRGPGMAGWSPDVVETIVTRQQPDGADLIHIFYANTPSSQGAGQKSLGRIFQRQAGRDVGVSLEAKDAQYQAVVEWGAPDGKVVERLANIAQPTLILQGDSDIMIPTKASYTLAGLIPNARITVFPDASHGSIFQYASDAAAETIAFLSE